MGLPIITHKLPPETAWANKTNFHNRFDNQSATFLNLVVDANATMWGFAPPIWQSMVGSVLVVRKDGKDISREHVWALAEYAQFTVSDRFEEAMESGSAAKRRQTAAKMVSIFF